MRNRRVAKVIPHRRRKLLLITAENQLRSLAAVDADKTILQNGQHDT